MGFFKNPIHIADNEEISVIGMGMVDTTPVLDPDQLTANQLGLLRGLLKQLQDGTMKTEINGSLANVVVDETGALKTTVSGIEIASVTATNVDSTIKDSTGANTLAIDALGNAPVILKGSYVERYTLLAGAADGNYHVIGANNKKTGATTDFLPFDVRQQPKKIIIIKDNTNVGLKVKLILTRTSTAFTASGVAYTVPDYNNIIYVSSEFTILPGGVKVFSSEETDVDKYDSALDKYPHAGVFVQLVRAASGGIGDASIILLGGV